MTNAPPNATGPPDEGNAAAPARRSRRIRPGWIGAASVLALAALGGLAYLLLPLGIDTPGFKGLFCRAIAEATGLSATLEALEIKDLGDLQWEGRSLALRDPSTRRLVAQAATVRGKLAGQGALRGEFALRNLSLEGVVVFLDHLAPQAAGRSLHGAAPGTTWPVFPPLTVKDARVIRTVAGREVELRMEGVEIRPSEDRSLAAFSGWGEVRGSRGELARFTAAGSARPDGAFRINLEMERMALASWARSWDLGGPDLYIGGVAGMTLVLDGRPEAVQCRGQWRIPGLTVSLPGILQEPFEAPEAAGSFTASWSRHAWSVQLHRADAGWLSVQGDIAAGASGLQGRFTVSPFAFEPVVRHLGERLVGRGLHAFFRQNLRSGQGREATFAFGGGSGGRGGLTMTLDFQKASILFDPRLQPLSDLSGTLVWQGDRVDFQDLQGTYRGHAVSPMEASITDIGRTSLLEGRFALALEPLQLVELFQSISLQAGGPPAELRLKGESTMDLRLRKGLLGGSPLEYEARIGLRHVSGTLPGGAANWQVSRGELMATPGRLEVLDLAGELAEFSGRARGGVDQWGGGSPRLALEGKVEGSAKALARLAARSLPGLEVAPGGTSTIAFSLTGPVVLPLISVSWDLEHMGLAYGGHWEKPVGWGLVLEASLEKAPGGAWRLVHGSARGPGGGLQGEGWLAAGAGERSWLHLWARRFPVDLAAGQIPALRGKLRGGEMDLRGELYWGRDRHWVATLSPRGVVIPQDLLGHEIRIVSGNLILSEGWHSADPLELEVLGRRYGFRGRLRPRGEGFSLEGRLQGDELRLDPWIFPGGGKGMADRDSTGSTPFPMNRWLQALPDSFLDLELGGLGLLDFVFKDVKGRLVVRGDSLILEGAVAELEGGRVAAEARLDGQGNFWLGGGVDDANAGAVLAKLGFQEELIEGPLHFQAGVGGQLVGKRAGRHEGNIELEIGRGVIRKFPVLANILSLMNLSQLLTGRLPDLSRDGLVFDSISASFSLVDGVARTEDFRLQSHAMVLSMLGDIDVRNNACDLKVGLHPLVGVDRLVSKIPVVRHYLEGPEKSVLTMYYLVKGPLTDPKVSAVPLRSLGEGVLGIFKRLLQNPFKDLGGSPGLPNAQVPEPPSH